MESFGIEKKYESANASSNIPVELPVVGFDHVKGAQEEIIKAQCRLGDGKEILLSYGYGQGFGEMPYAAVSSSSGCSVDCKFCSVPAYDRCLTPEEIVGEVRVLTALAKEKGIYPSDDRFRISFTKEGEPALHKSLQRSLEALNATFPRAAYKISTIFPEGEVCKRNLHDVIDFQRRTGADILLQISLHGTSMEARGKVAKRKLADFSTIGKFGEEWSQSTGCKITLAFTVRDEDVLGLDPMAIRGILPPDNFEIRVRGIVDGNTSLLTEGGFKAFLERFEEAGYGVTDGRATEMEINNGTEVGVYQPLSGSGE